MGHLRKVRTECILNIVGRKVQEELQSIYTDFIFFMRNHCYASFVTVTPKETTSELANMEASSTPLNGLQSVPPLLEKACEWLLPMTYQW